MRKEGVLFLSLNFKMHCSFTELRHLLSAHTQHNKHLFDNTIPNGGNVKRIVFRNLILLGCFIVLPGKEAKRLNRSVVSYRVGQTSSPSASFTPRFTSPQPFVRFNEENDQNTATLLLHDLHQLPKSTKASYPAQFQGRAKSNLSGFPGSREAEGMPQFERQIVPLPMPTSRKPSKLLPNSTKFAMQLYKLYNSFLVDYAVLNGWTSAKLIVPHENDEIDDSDDDSLCKDFSRKVLLSKASLNLECPVNYTQLARSECVSPTKCTPLIIADFIDENGDDNVRQLINSHLLITYSPKRPIIVLAGNEGINKILERYQPRILTNYKWTLAQPTQGIREDGDQNNATGVAKEQIKIYDVLGITSSPKSLHQLIGGWNAHGGTFSIDDLKRNGVYSFGGRKLRVTTIRGPPLVYFHRPTTIVQPMKQRSISATGYLLDIFGLAAFVLNFTYDVLTPDDRAFGSRSDDGSWSGMIGMLQRNEADLALMSISYTKSRKSVMDYSPPVEYSSTQLLIRRDWTPAELKWDAYIRPFEWKVWLTIFFLIGLGTITLVTFVNFKLFRASPGQSMWLLSTCFLLQGQNEHSTIRVTPFRIAVGTFWLLAVFIFACYTARLTSFLAADTQRTPVKDLSEALKSSAWKIGLVRGSSFLEKVKESQDREMKLLWKRIQKNPSVLVDGISEGVSRVYKERYIFFTSDLIPKFLMRGNCSYTWLPGKYFPGFGSMGYQKNLPYASAISHVIARLRETGLMRRTFKKWWGISVACNSRSSDSFQAISLQETGSAFLILSIGATLALIFTLIEYLLWMKESDRESNNVRLQRLPNTEFAAEVVHGPYKNILPTIFEEERPFIWNNGERNENHSMIWRTYDSR